MRKVSEHLPNIRTSSMITSEPDQKPGFLIGNVSYSRNGRTSTGRAQRES